MKGIGLFGGTFNPVHLGHLQVAEDVRTEFDLEKIVFIPSAIPPHKSADGLADAQARYAMILEALSPFSQFVASDAEIHRPGPSYTIDTVAYFQSYETVDKTCYWMVGMDAFLEITTWKDWQLLLDRIPFIVMTRPGQSASFLADPPVEMERYIQTQVDKGYGYVPEKSCFAHKAKQPVFVARVSPMAISASDIRDRVRKGHAIRHLVPAGVADYIKYKGLYK